MKMLVAMPCLFNAEATRKSIESILYAKPFEADTIDLLIIDNGSEPEVHKMLIEYAETLNKNTARHPRLVLKINQQNIYVNPAWNQAMDHFLKGEYDILCIANSDFRLQKDWAKLLRHAIGLRPNSIIIPMHLTDEADVQKPINPFEFSFTEVSEGTAGVFIILNRQQVKLCYPIPSQIKIWFGDNWIYDGLRSLGIKTQICTGVSGFHYGSQNVSRLPEAPAIIEEDKIAWANDIAPVLKEEFIKRLRELES